MLSANIFQNPESSLLGVFLFHVLCAFIPDYPLYNMNLAWYFESTAFLGETRIFLHLNSVTLLLRLCKIIFLAHSPILMLALPRNFAYNGAPLSGALAQLVERLHRTQQVRGSNPLCSRFLSMGVNAIYTHFFRWPVYTGMIETVQGRRSVL